MLGEARWDHVRLAAKSARFAEQQAQCYLLRDIFGEYFGPPGSEGGWLPFSDGHEYWCLLPTRKIITIRPEWLAWSDGLVKRMAQAIYDEEAFERLPVLADAIEEAGCTECDLLDHLRQPGPHVRGCWIVDALIAK